MAAPKLSNFILKPREVFKYMIEPHFADMVPGTGVYGGVLNGFTLMDDVPYKKEIVNVKRLGNILERRDKRCEINYKKIGDASVRQIETVELQGGVKHCKHEFYRGCMKDWRANDPLFGNKLIDGFFQDAAKMDLYTNAWFGDIDKAGNSTYSTNLFNGVFYWLKKYTAAGIIPSAQTMNIATKDYRANPADAYAVIKGLYDRQNPIMRSYPNADKEFRVSPQILDGYNDYLRMQGGGDTLIIEKYANGVNVTSYNGIAIYAEPLWEPILGTTVAANAVAGILTFRGNNVFGTDKDYGEEGDGETPKALNVWYENKDLTWYWQLFAKGGTQIGLPEHVVVGVPA